MTIKSTMTPLGKLTVEMDAGTFGSSHSPFRSVKKVPRVFVRCHECKQAASWVPRTDVNPTETFGNHDVSVHAAVNDWRKESPLSYDFERALCKRCAPFDKPHYIEVPGERNEAPDECTRCARELKHKRWYVPGIVPPPEHLCDECAREATINAIKDVGFEFQ